MGLRLRSIALRILAVFGVPREVERLSERVSVLRGSHSSDLLCGCLEFTDFFVFQVCFHLHCCLGVHVSSCIHS